MIEYREFGKSGLKVSALGYGAGQLGDAALSAQEVRGLLGCLQQMGINLIDTARGYGESEARIGRLLPGKREQWVISTKIGYGVEGVADWTEKCIRIGIDQALQRLQTDYLDIAHLHSCPVQVLRQGEVTLALQTAVKHGKVRVAAYSGENEALAWAIKSGAFGSVQCSVNLCDQYSLRELLPQAREQGLGVIAKRPLANAFWRFVSQPHGDYSEVYWQRWHKMAVETDLAPEELAVRFTVYAAGVHSAIIGTRRPEHLEQNLRLAAKGPLPADLLRQISERFSVCGAGWQGEI